MQDKIAKYVLMQMHNEEVNLCSHHAYEMRKPINNQKSATCKIFTISCNTYTGGRLSFLIPYMYIIYCLL